MRRLSSLLLIFTLLFYSNAWSWDWPWNNSKKGTTTKSASEKIKKSKHVQEVFSNLKHQRTLYMEIENNPKKYFNKLVCFIVFAPRGRLIYEGGGSHMFGSLVNTATQITYEDTPVAICFDGTSKIVNHTENSPLSVGQVATLTGRFGGFWNVEGEYLMFLHVTKMVITRDVIEE